MSLWNWSKYYGEAKPFIHPGPLRRHLPVNKIFSKTADITNFLNDMKGHLDDHGNINPFPNRGIYLRRVKSNPPPTESSDPDNPEADIDLHKPSFLKGLGLNDNPEENEAYILSLSKINLLLTPFGSHLTSLIFECGVTADLKSLEDLRDILEKVRNLQYLMLKGVRIQQKAPVEHLPFPELPNLKSVKVIRCRGILESLIYAYHNQLETFQVVNSRDNYFPSLKKLLQQQQSDDEGDSGKRGLIFGKLRELKFGELERCKEFDNFVEFLKGDADEEVNIFPRLDHLSILYSMYGTFCDKPVEKLFEPLEHLPRLKEFNVGICGSTGFNFGEDEKCGRFNFGGGGGSGKLVRRLSVPVQWIRYPSLVARLVRGMSGLEIVRFLRNNEDGTREEFSKEMETVVDGMLRDFAGLKKVEIVDIIGDQENIICGAVAV